MYGSQRALSWEMESSYCLAIADVPNPGALVSWHSKGPRGYCKEPKKKNMKVEGDLLVIGRLHGKGEKDKRHNGKEVTEPR